MSFQMVLMLIAVGLIAAAAVFRVLAGVGSGVTRVLAFVFAGAMVVLVVLLVVYLFLE